MSAKLGLPPGNTQGKGGTDKVSASALLLSPANWLLCPNCTVAISHPHRRLEEELGLARMSAGCHGELQQVQQELKAKKQLELELRESLRRAKEEGRAWRDEVTRMKAQLDKEESEVIQKLEERVQKLERQLRESQARITVGIQNTAIQRFEENTEAFLQTPFIREDKEGYVALEPVHGHQTDGSQLEESNKWSQMLEDVLGKHFDQLDCSLTKILSPK